MTSDLLYMTSHPLFRTSHHFMYDIKSTICPQVHCICPHVHCISVITPNLSMTSQPLYGWYHIQFICDIISPIVMKSYPLSMTSQHSLLMTPHSAYVWHPWHCRWNRMHSLTPNHSIYDVTSTSGMISHPLYQILHPLYLRPHSLSNDITPTFEWHHTHLLCDIICTIYNIISNPYVITLL